MKITNGETDLVSNPELKLSDVRDQYGANECGGRGSATAAPRGYNVERLADAIFNSEAYFFPLSDRPWFDTEVWSEDDQRILVESKSCIHRYPSGGYGQFRIWWSHHTHLRNNSSNQPDDRQIYFFLVYTIDENGDAEEVGKLGVEVDIIDELITDWRWVDHSTKGRDEMRDISWHLLLSRLGISVEQFRDEDIVVVTDRD
jgi:hypothetical protein